MILMYGKNPVGNVIHAVMGPESDLWTDMHGALTVDITPLLGMCDSDAPVLLNVTRCLNEAQLSARLNSALSAGGAYPFLPGTVMFTAPSHPAPKGQPQAIPDSKLGAQAPAEKPAKKSGGRTVEIQIGLCERCSDKRAELVPNMAPAICFNCAKIDLYQARKERGNPGSAPGLPEEFR